MKKEIGKRGQVRRKEKSSKKSLLREKNGPSRSNLGETMGWDVYEEALQSTKDLDPKRFDPVDVYEYELPSEFEDEEIDEELAFDEDDDARFGDFFLSMKERVHHKKSESVEEEEEEEEEERELLKKSQKTSFHKNHKVDSRDEVDDLFEEGGVSGISDLSDETDDETEEQDADNTDLSGILPMYQGFSKADQAEENSVENQHNKESELTLEDLIASARSIGADKRLNRFMSNENESKGSKPQTKTSSTDLQASRGRLPVPLSRNIQERLHREAAYVETSKDISKWTPIVRRNRDADQLRFPMNESKPIATTQTTLAAQFDPETDMERQIAEALLSSGINRPDTTKSNPSTLDTINPPDQSSKEIHLRKGDLEKARAYNFFREQRTKRSAKIKSRSFRKRVKKEKAKSTELDSSTQKSSESTMEDILNYERQRARERMSLKNRSRLNTIKRDLEATQELLQEHDERLGSEDDSEQESFGDNLPRIARSFHDESFVDASLRESVSVRNMDVDEFSPDQSNLFDNQTACNKTLTELSPDSDDDTSFPKKGLFAMKFMQRAMEKRQKAESQSSLGFIDNQSIGDIETQKDNIFSKGRRIFGLKKTNNISGLAQDIHQGDDRSDDARQPKKHMDNDLTSNDETNRDLLPLTSEAYFPERSENEDSKDLDEALHDYEPKEEIVSISLPLKNKEPARYIRPDRLSETPKPGSLKGNDNYMAMKKQKTTISPLEDTKDLMRIEKAIKRNGETSFEEISQKDLIRRAFAGDNIIEKDFEEEKAKIIDLEMPKEEILTLPGWGHWAGDGTKGPKQLLVRRPLPNARDNMLKKRKDFKLKHVIIQEKVNKKSVAFMADHVPFPFETRAQYEQSIRAPIGAEWNTQISFQKLIKPRILSKAGSVIDPIKFSQNELQQARHQKRHNPFSVTGS